MEVSFGKVILTIVSLPQAVEPLREVILGDKSDRVKFESVLLYNSLFASLADLIVQCNFDTDFKELSFVYEVR